MLINNGDGTMTAGPLDFICILRDVRGARFHPCFVEERPMPGPVKSIADTPFIRAKSKMHHTTGFGTFEEAQRNVLEDFAKKIVLPPANVGTKKAINWDSADVAFVVVLPNWVADKKTIDDVLSVDAIGVLTNVEVTDV